MYFLTGDGGGVGLGDRLVNTWSRLAEAAFELYVGVLPTDEFLLGVLPPFARRRNTVKRRVSAVESTSSSILHERSSTFDRGSRAPGRVDGLDLDLLGRRDADAVFGERAAERSAQAVRQGLEHLAVRIGRSSRATFTLQNKQRQCGEQYVRKGATFHMKNRTVSLKRSTASSMNQTVRLTVTIRREEAYDIAKSFQ